MNRFSKVIAAVGVIAGVLIVGAVLGWWGSRSPQPGGENVGPKSNSTALANADSNAASAIKKKLRSDYRKTRRTKPGTNANPAQASGSATNLTAEWEDKVDEILTSEGKDADKAKQMLALFPNLPEDGQEEVAQHLSNLVPDEDYAPLGKLLTDAKLPESVLDVLMADVLNRPNAVKLPTLLEVARNPQHPGASEAKGLLDLFLDPDEEYGNDWARWQTKMEQWLKENPD